MKPHPLVHGSAQDPGRPSALFMSLQSKHPNQDNTASCLYAAASALRKFRHISSLRLFLCSLDKALFAGDVAERIIIIYRRLLLPRGNVLNTIWHFLCFAGAGTRLEIFSLLLSASWKLMT